MKGSKRNWRWSDSEQHAHASGIAKQWMDEALAGHATFIEVELGADGFSGVRAGESSLT